jgi:hypothetical protein
MDHLIINAGTTTARGPGRIRALAREAFIIAIDREELHSFGRGSVAA